MMIFTMNVFATGFGQFSFKAEDKKVREVLDIIEQNSNYRFFYNDEFESIDKVVNLKVESENINQVLDKLLATSDYTYSLFENNLIVISLKNNVREQSNLQQNIVRGTVKDEEGNPIPGVTIVLKGTTLGTTTDINGNYIINVVDPQSVLVFSFIGYTLKEEAIGGRRIVDVTLDEETTALEEVVVIGYGTKIKSTVTGSISAVKSEDLATFSASTNIVDALQANVSGAFVLANSGRPGETSNIYLRGPVSVNGGDPLYVIDGIPQDNIGYNFNLEDIESISVLKDASAAAIYGAKAAGGVILVTTKRGMKSNLKISANASFGVRNVMYLPPLFRRDEYIKAKALAGHDVVDLYGPENGWKDLPDTDWFNEIFRTGTEENYGISLTGGGETSTYFLSGNYNRVIGVGIGNWIKRYTFRINTDHQILKKLKFSQGLYFKTGAEDPSEGGMGQSFRQQPVMAVYDPTAVDNMGYAKVVKGFQGNNRVQGLLSNKELNKDYSLYLNGTLTYNIFDALNFSVFGGTTMAFGDDYNYTYPLDNGAFVNNATISKSQNKTQDYIVTYTLNYDKTFNNHHISGLAGYEARKKETSAVEYNNLETLIHEPQSSALVSSVLNQSGAFTQSNVFDRILSQFGRIEYTYANKYLATANIRRDGYGSKFGPNNKYGIFPGISTGWVISREEFFRNVPFIEMLKIRAGYGLLGNAVGSDFAYTSFYTVGYAQDWSETDTNTKQTSIALASQLANEEIKWESVATTNFGLDGVLLNGVLSFNIDYYSRQTKEMLYNVPISPSAGVGTRVQANVGQMSNKGLELYLEYRDNIGVLNYNVGINFGTNKNRLISLSPDIEKLYIASGYIAGESGSGLYGAVNPNRSEPGLPLGQFYGYEAVGIYQTDIGENEKRPTVDNFVPQAGDLIFVDQNDDGVMNTADQVYIGNPWPKFTYGLTLGGNWKNMITLKAIFNGTVGNDIYNAYQGYAHNFYSDYNSTPAIYKTSFFGDNGVTDVPRAATISRPDRAGNWTKLSSYHVQDGSYLQLKNLQIGITLPKNIVSRLGVKNARALLTGENLFILTKYKGLCPIVAPYQRSILNQGVENASGRYPFSRLYSLGVNIDF